MVILYVKRSWEAYKKNFLNFIFAELLIFIIIGAIAGIGIGIIFLTTGVSSIPELKSTFTLTKIVSLYPFLLNLSIAVLFFFIAAMAAALFLTGFFGMAEEALKGLSSVKKMLRVSKESGLRGVITSLIIGLAAFLLMVVLVIGFGILFSVPGLLFGTIIFLLIMVFFSLAFPAIIVDDLNPIEAIGKSFYVCKKNYSDIFSLLLFYALISLIFSFIPFIGQVILYFVIFPMFCMSLILFYKRKRF